MSNEIKAELDQLYAEVNKARKLYRAHVDAHSEVFHKEAALRSEFDAAVKAYKTTLTGAEIDEHMDVVVQKPAKRWHDPSKLRRLAPEFYRQLKDAGLLVWKLEGPAVRKAIADGIIVPSPEEEEALEASLKTEPMTPRVQGVEGL